MSGVLTRSVLVRRDSLDRLDAEYFDPLRLKAEQALQDAGGSRLGDTYRISETKVPDPAKGAKPDDVLRYVEIRSVDPRDGFVLYEPIAAVDAPSRARMALEKGMVGLSSVRPIRSQVLLIDKWLDGAVGTNGFVLLERKDSRGPTPEVLFALLKSRPVIAQLDRRTRASMYPTLHPPDVLDVTLPAISGAVSRAVQKQIEQAVDKHSSFLQLADELQGAADAYFASMGPDRLIADLSGRRRTIRKLSDLSGSAGMGRLDAEFHAIAFDAAFKRMRDAGQTEKLGNLLSAAHTGSSPSADEMWEVDPGSSSAILKVGALTNVGINWSAVTFAPRKFADVVTLRVMPGDILFNSTAHQPKYMAHKIDVVSAMPQPLTGRVSFTGDLMRLRVKDPDNCPPHYLAAFLRSPLGKEQIRRSIRGISSHVYPDDIGEILVPVPPKDVAANIAKKARKRDSVRLEYTKLVRDAIGLVEKHVGV